MCKKMYVLIITIVSIAYFDGDEEGSQMSHFTGQFYCYQ